jgi:hypothetical protein
MNRDHMNEKIDNACRQVAHAQSTLYELKEYISSTPITTTDTNYYHHLQSQQKSQCDQIIEAYFVWIVTAALLTIIVNYFRNIDVQLIK